MYHLFTHITNLSGDCNYSTTSCQNIDSTETVKNSTFMKNFIIHTLLIWQDLVKSSSTIHNQSRSGMQDRTSAFNVFANCRWTQWYKKYSDHLLFLSQYVCLCITIKAALMWMLHFTAVVDNKKVFHLFHYLTYYCSLSNNIFHCEKEVN